jgi:HPt (histidine-containing phosphotransfer) domain-containing protein
MESHDGIPADEHVDEEVLSELFSLLDDGTTDGLIGVCDLFLLGAPTTLAEIEDALAGQRPDDVRRLAHTLRGTAGAFGALRLSQLAGQLEAVGQGPDLTPAGALVAEMRAEYETFRAILMSRLAASGAR